MCVSVCMYAYMCEYAYECVLGGMCMHLYVYRYGGVCVDVFGCVYMFDVCTDACLSLYV